MLLTQTGAGSVDNSDDPVFDPTGSGMLPLQADGDGATTFKVMGRVSADMPWVEIVAAGTADFLQSIAWVPFLQLVVTSGSGTVKLAVAQVG